MKPDTGRESARQKQRPIAEHQQRNLAIGELKLPKIRPCPGCQRTFERTIEKSNQPRHAEPGIEQEVSRVPLRLQIGKIGLMKYGHRPRWHDEEKGQDEEPRSKASGVGQERSQQRREK